MEHRRPNGDLVQGWYCAFCGDAVAMGGHSREDRKTGVCNSNLELVMALHAANMNPRIRKPHFKYNRTFNHTMLY